MGRAERLLALLELLRRHRRPVRGELLAGQLGISLRTLYRDIAALQAQGATIEGEAGVGYLLRPGHSLPPLMFGVEEIEALALGVRWVAQRSADPILGVAARQALARIRAVLPTALRHELDHNPLLVPPVEQTAGDPRWPSLLRQALRQQRCIRVGYCDGQGRFSERELWPFALGFFEQSRVLSAWCELRQDYRHFRLDRLQTLELLDRSYPRPRQALLAEWRAREGIPPLE